MAYTEQDSPRKEAAWLAVESKKGQTRLTKEFEIKDKHWAVVNYWYYPKSHYSPWPKHFSFDIQDKPTRFE